MIARRLTLVVAGAFAASVLMAGAAQAVCDPHCSPKSNSGGEVRGLDRANSVAGEHGANGRANAAAKQGVVPTPAPVVIPPSLPPPPPMRMGTGFLMPRINVRPCPDWHQAAVPRPPPGA